MTTEQLLAERHVYARLLGIEQALKLLNLFTEIENGKYNKEELHAFELPFLKHIVYMRAIRADMQSFVNTFIDPYLEKKPYLNDVRFVIDGGANIGYTAVLYANWWPDAKIVSLEPDEGNFELALKNTAAYPNVQIIKAGVWCNSAQLTIEAGQEDGFVVRELKDSTAVSPQNLTQGVSILDLLRQNQATEIDFLKLNVEGSEKEIFTENYAGWLPHTKAMLIELHDGKNKGCSRAVFAATGQHDFAVAETAAYGVLFVKEAIYRNWYSNWYRESIYKPNIDKNRFPEFYLDKEQT